MKIETHSHRRGREIFRRNGENYHFFAGLLVGTAQSGEDVFAVSAHWRKFLREHGWVERKTPLQTSGFVKDQFLQLDRVCLSLSFAHGDQVGHVLLALQGLFHQGEIDLGILSVDGQDTFARVKADLAWLRRVVTVPLWLVAVK